MQQFAESIEEICPSCGNFVNTLNDITGFCGTCSISMGVGVFNDKTPTPIKPSRVELWLRNNADIIEDLMVEQNQSARQIIKSLISNKPKAICECCGNLMPHATSGRHRICTKTISCRKARRYYRYLRYEKGLDKDKAITRAIAKYRNQ